MRGILIIFRDQGGPDGVVNCKKKETLGGGKKRLVYLSPRKMTT